MREDVSYNIISIHALLAESDSNNIVIVVIAVLFLSTLSLRRATWQRGSRITYVEISIHALLAESDYDTSSLMQCQAKFLSTLSLRRATNADTKNTSFHKLFLSTLSLRRATARRALGFVDPDISIHALLAESDVLVWCSCGGACAFLSTLSLRRATNGEAKTENITLNFYPRSPCGERP